jgi:hypothetical protein
MVDLVRRLHQSKAGYIFTTVCQNHEQINRNTDQGHTVTMMMWHNVYAIKLTWVSHVLQHHKDAHALILLSSQHLCRITQNHHLGGPALRHHNHHCTHLVWCELIWRSHNDKPNCTKLYIALFHTSWV